MGVGEEEALEVYKMGVPSVIRRFGLHLCRYFLQVQSWLRCRNNDSSDDADDMFFC